MRLVLIILGSLFTLAAIGLTLLIWGLVQLVGPGKDFWSVGIVQLDVVCWLVALGCWIYLTLGGHRN